MLTPKNSLLRRGGGRGRHETGEFSGAAASGGGEAMLGRIRPPGGRLNFREA